MSKFSALVVRQPIVEKMRPQFLLPMGVKRVTTLRLKTPIALGVSMQVAIISDSRQLNSPESILFPHAKYSCLYGVAEVSGHVDGCQILSIRMLANPIPVLKFDKEFKSVPANCDAHIVTMVSRKMFEIIETLAAKEDWTRSLVVDVNVGQFDEIEV